jgi:hypothetical protein
VPRWDTINARAQRVEQVRWETVDFITGHAFGPHVLGSRDRPLPFTNTLREFPGIRTLSQFRGHIYNVISNPTRTRILENGRSAFWHNPSGTLVIVNTRNLPRSTAFQPTNGEARFWSLR